MRCTGASVSRSRAELSHALSAAAEEMPPLKTNHFSPRLLTNGSHVRIRTAGPFCFSNSTDTGERCESDKQMNIQSDARCNEWYILKH
jgi:hypothetical protein